jgi:hypothetical protein
MEYFVNVNTHHFIVDGILCQYLELSPLLTKNYPNIISRGSKNGTRQYSFLGNKTKQMQFFLFGAIVFFDSLVSAFWENILLNLTLWLFNF